MSQYPIPGRNVRERALESLLLFAPRTESVPRLLIAAALCLSLVVSGAVASAETDGILSGYSLTSWHDGAGRPLGSVSRSSSPTTATSGSARTRD